MLVKVWEFLAYVTEFLSSQLKKSLSWAILNLALRAGTENPKQAVSFVKMVGPQIIIPGFSNYCHD